MAYDGMVVFNSTPLKAQTSCLACPLLQERLGLRVRYRVGARIVPGVSFAAGVVLR